MFHELSVLIVLRLAEKYNLKISHISKACFNIISNINSNMAIEKGTAHRPGVFKQSNKEHKHGRHRSKGSISSSAKGKRSLINP